jgi:hypothetical protein
MAKMRSFLTTPSDARRIPGAGLVARLLVPVLLAWLSGCASYGDWVGQMERQIAAGNAEAAMQVLERHSGEEGRDAVLYQLNRGMLLRLQDDPAASVAAFQTAKGLIDQLLAVSVSEQAGAFAVNDAQRSYIGEPYERAFIHFYAALGYLEQGDRDSARVEMLQLDLLLRGLEREDIVGTALPRYLSALVFEANGEWSDALIAARKAYEAYRAYPAASSLKPPRTLVRDLIRLSNRMGLEDEAARYRAEAGLDAERRPKDGASLVVLLHSGLAPVKREGGVTVPTTAGRLVSVSLPHYPPPRRPRIAGARVAMDGASARTEAAENIDAAARAALDAQSGAILARTVARAAVKHEASRRAGQENELAGLIVNLAGLVSERADTRSWTTLPHTIHLARLEVPSGQYQARIELFDGSGATVEVIDHPIDLRPGELSILSVHRIHPADVAAPN